MCGKTCVPLCLQVSDSRMTSEMHLHVIIASFVCGEKNVFGVCASVINPDLAATGSGSASFGGAGRGRENGDFTPAEERERRPRPRLFPFPRSLPGNDQFCRDATLRPRQESDEKSCKQRS